MRMMNFTAEDIKQIQNKSSVPKPDEEICPYFLEGRCRYGNNC